MATTHLSRSAAMKNDDVTIDPSPPKRQRFTYDEPTSSLFESAMTEDLFLLLMGFFVSPDAVDGATIRSMSSVCKQWYQVVNTPSLWSKSAHDVTASSPTIACLIGFRKLTRLATTTWKPDLAYRVEERATKQRHVVRIVQNEELRTRLDLLRHLRMTSDLVRSSAEQHQHGECLVLPRRFEPVVNGVVVWYDHFDESLSDWLYNNHKKCQQDCYNQEDVPNRLPIPLEQFKSWIVSILTAIKAIGCSRGAHENLEKRIRPRICPETIFVDKETMQLRLCLPDGDDEPLPLWSLPDTVSGPELCGRGDRCPELWSAGFVMAQIARSGKPLFHCPKKKDGIPFSNLVVEVSSAMSGEQPAPETRRIFQDFRRELPMLCNSGFDCLLRLFEEKENGITLAEDPLQHPFLLTGANCSTVSLVLSKAPQVAPLDPKRRHVKFHQWAALMDWVWEVCSVFDFKSNTAFHAMAYFDKFISNSCGEEQSPARYQLLAGACLLLASKMFPGVLLTMRTADIVFSADNTFSCADVDEAERSILAVLVSQPNAHPYADYNSLCSQIVKSLWTTNILPPWERRKFLSAQYYVCDMAQYTEVYLWYDPPTIAAAIFIITASSQNLNQRLWVPILEKQQRLVGLDDLQDPVNLILSDIHRLNSTLPELKAVKRKYYDIRVQFPVRIVLQS